MFSLSKKETRKGRMTIAINEDLLNSIRDRAIKENISLNTLVALSVKAYLKRKPIKARA